jgi:hypothetical protein
MKKVFFLIAFTFAVVCYAAPPPDLIPDPVTDQCGFVVQNNQNVTVYTLNVQEVTYNYLGDFEFATCISEYSEQVYDVVLPQATIIDVSYNRLNELNKPPAFYCNSGVINSNRTFMMNKQNSNFGYPFGADYPIS